MESARKLQDLPCFKVAIVPEGGIYYDGDDAGCFAVVPLCKINVACKLWRLEDDVRHLDQASSFLGFVETAQIEGKSSVALGIIPRQAFIFKGENYKPYIPNEGKGVTRKTT
jgi:hypothetical protein